MAEALATDNPYSQEADRSDASGRYELNFPQHFVRTMTMNAMNPRWPGSGLGLVLGCLGFVALLRCEAQNLVPNHSFEEYDTCRVVNDVYYPPTGPLHWYSAGWTPDHMMSCLPYGSLNGVPLNAWSFQYPQDGACYAGVITYHQNFEGREFFMVELTESLVQGQTYYGSFYANAAWGGYEVHPQHWVATSHIGMLFTMQPRQWEYNDPIPAPGNFAHMVHPWIIADTVGWTLVSGSFVADSAYTYLMLGNFFSNALTDTLHFESVIPAWAMYSYALLDAVCVSPDPKGCELSQGVEELGGAVPSVYPNPAKDVLVIGNAAGSNAVVLDILGRRLWQGRVSHDRFAVDVGRWARGAYVLQLHDARGARAVKFVLAE